MTTTRLISYLGIAVMYLSLTPLVFWLAGLREIPAEIWLGAAYAGLAGMTLTLVAGVSALTRLAQR